MEVVLTSEQLRQVEELKKKDQVSCPPGVSRSAWPFAFSTKGLSQVASALAFCEMDNSPSP